MKLKNFVCDFIFLNDLKFVYVYSLENANFTRTKSKKIKGTETKKKEAIYPLLISSLLQKTVLSSNGFK